ncbi:hypothetical protein RND81_07G054700 [Saponaria officinalis]|uniref:Endonuclease/exonuclease/phosphatase domain-containing protein n=1 Tax=Saponaria officinalis TaxID=3572 RepID=A0AAW1JP38_SAPOF
MKLASRNIRGVNHPSKQQELRHFLLKHRVDVMGLVETRVKAHNASSIGSKLFGHNWGVADNYQFHPNGRIWLAWNKARTRVDVIHTSTQVITSSLSASCDMPWLLMGDFNVVLHDDEKRSDAMFDHGSMRDFGDFCQQLQLMDLPSQGMFYTWSNKQLADARILCKLDRPGVSDHSPALAYFVTPNVNKGKCFKFLNGWVLHQGFQQTVRDHWVKRFRGTKMYCFFQKLKSLKGELRELHKRNYSLISQRVVEASADLFLTQQQLHSHPGDQVLMQKESSDLEKFLMLRKAELSFSKQRAKIRNIQLNDEGTSYFYAKIKERACKNKIGSILHNGSLATTDASIGEAFVAYYTNLLGVEHSMADFGQLNVGGAKLAEEKHGSLLLPVLESEIRDALFGIADDKAPGIDGFSSGFFKSTWSSTGPDLIAAVRDFFTTNKMLKTVNSTILTLVPKVESPTQVTQFRPIACCTVVYKVISRVLANRLRLVLGDLISMA